ncbi:hypothetical protein E4U42_004876 [Claviceps africana]|uniref:DH domain-containing protein n=1 Tax=Claviceps africana TaxID=83212 RepID=A0A8K0NLE1_9HYPO|nr:hypothetical protein E4U42_004876 [Claviceps africana]
MAVAISGFHTTRLSLDDRKSSQPTSPPIFDQNSQSALPQWIECLSRGSDGIQNEQNHVKLPIATDHAAVCRIRPASQLISCDMIFPTPPGSIDDDIDTCNKQRARSTLQRWMGSLQKRTRQRSTMDTAYGNRVLPWVWAIEGQAHSSKSIHYTHRKSFSDSSFRFISAVRSASTSFAASRTENAFSQCESQVDFEVEAFQVLDRSFDDEKMTSSVQQVDSAAVERALQRRKILRELIDTEKSYLGDIRFLLNVYVTMLASLPASHPGLRRSVNQNLCEILQLHEEIFSELSRAISQSIHEELGQPPSAQFANPDLVQENPLGDSQPACNGIEQAARIKLPTGSLAGPLVVAEVSRVFEKKMSRFFIYEEYGAKYDMILQDIVSVDQVLPGWEWNQRGLEALSDRGTDIYSESHNKLLESTTVPSHTEEYERTHTKLRQQHYFAQHKPLTLAVVHKITSVSSIAAKDGACTARDSASGRLEPRNSALSWRLYTYSKREVCPYISFNRHAKAQRDGYRELACQKNRKLEAAAVPRRSSTSSHDRDDGIRRQMATWLADRYE